MKNLIKNFIEHSYISLKQSIYLLLQKKEKSFSKDLSIYAAHTIFHFLFNSIQYDFPKPR